MMEIKVAIPPLVILLLVGFNACAVTSVDWGDFHMKSTRFIWDTKGSLKYHDPTTSKTLEMNLHTKDQAAVTIQQAGRLYIK